MKTGKIPSRYARAFFEFALEQNILEEALQDMTLIAEVTKDHKELQNLLKSPVVSSSKKISILREIFAPHCHRITVDFITLLARNDREVFLHDIASHFMELYQQHKGILPVQLTSAAPVNEAIRKEILRQIEAHTGAKATLTERVDPSLIGGFILEFAGNKYDASFRHRLGRLKKEFKINLYKREI